jgi:hypothetical protein
MRSLGTFPSTPITHNKLRLSGAKKPVLSAPTSTRSVTPDIFNEPVTDRGRRHDRSSEDHLPPRSECSLPHSECSLTASRSLSPAPPTKKGKVSEWHNSQAPQGRAKARDYENTVYHGLVQACHDFEARIGASGAWPDPEEQIVWARETWDIVCKDIGKQYELTKRMLGLVSDNLYFGSMFTSNFSSQIKSRGSCALGDVKDIVRAKIAATYGFVLSDKKNTIWCNQRRAEMLLEDNAFHYKVLFSCFFAVPYLNLIQDPETLSGYAQRRIISDILHDAWFLNKMACSVKFSDYFKPITLYTLSLIFSAVHFNIPSFSLFFPPWGLIVDPILHR